MMAHDGLISLGGKLTMVISGYDVCVCVCVCSLRRCLHEEPLACCPMRPCSRGSDSESVEGVSEPRIVHYKQHIYIYIHIHVYKYIRMCIYIYIYIYTHTYTSLSLSIYIYIDR